MNLQEQAREATRKRDNDKAREHARTSELAGREALCALSKMLELNSMDVEIEGIYGSREEGWVIDLAVEGLRFQARVYYKSVSTKGRFRQRISQKQFVTSIEFVLPENGSLRSIDSLADLGAWLEAVDRVRDGDYS